MYFVLKAKENYAISSLKLFVSPCVSVQKPISLRFFFESFHKEHLIFRLRPIANPWFVMIFLQLLNQSF